MSLKITNNAWATLANTLAASSAAVQVTLSSGQGARWPSLNSANVTITNASPGVITWTAHGLVANQTVVFNTNGGSIPTGLSAGVAYYLVPGTVTTNTFQVSTTPLGTAINTSSNQSGTVTGSSDWTYSTLQNAGGNIEVVKVTAISGDVLTVVRGWDNTSVQAWAIADRFEDRPCAAAFNDKLTTSDANLTYATLASPTFTGTPTLPTGTVATTQSSTDSSTKLATTAYVQSQWTTGDIKVTLKTAADSGWVLVNDGTIGDASSSGTCRANADTAALFTLLWTNCSNTDCPVLPSGHGVSAAADFAAHKTINLPLALGRALAIAGTGTGLTARVLGNALGEEKHTIAANELPAHSHTITDPGHVHSSVVASAQQTSSGGGFFAATGGNTSSAVTGITATNNSTAPAATSNVMQPTTFVNIMIKL